MRIGVLVSLLFIFAGCGKSTPAPPAARNANTSAQERRDEGNFTVGQPLAAGTKDRVPGEKPAPGEPLDLRYVPDDVFAVLIFNARRALQSQALAALPFDELLAGSLEAWNFDPRDVEHWLLFFTPPVAGEPLDTPYSPGAVMRFVKPVDGQKLIATRGATRQIRLNGKPCYVQDVQPATAFHVADDRTIVFAAEKQLERMLLPKTNTRNPLVELAAGTSREIDFFLAINVEVLAPVIASMTGGSGQQPPAAMVPYIRSLDDVSMMTAIADLSGEQLFAARIEARDPQAALRLHQLAKQSGPLVQVGYSSLRAEITRNWVEQAAQGVLSVTDSIMARAAVSYEPTSIRLDVARPPQLDDLGRRITAALARKPLRR